jgi:quinol monooxygenase YgiN
MTMVISTLRILTAPRSRAEVVRTLAAQLGPTRVQPGCRKCDLYQDVDHPEAITLVEEWESQADLDPRLRSEDYRAVLAAIELSQEPPVIHFDTVTRRTGNGVLGQRKPRQRRPF